MKLLFDEANEKNSFGIKIVEYCAGNNLFPTDCAIAYFRNNEYPCKINRGFHEMLFILEGVVFLEFENEVVYLKKQDA